MHVLLPLEGSTDSTTPQVDPLYLHLSVTDPETVAALSEAHDGRDRQELALTALKIGILSLKAARGTVDGAAIRHRYHEHIFCYRR